MKVSLKSSRKETKDASKHFEKEQHDNENKIKDLENYKSSKTMEERELKNKNKKVDKKLKMIHEKEAKLDLEKREIEKIKHQVKNDKNETRLELDTNENLIADEQVDVKKYPPNQTTEPFCLSNTSTMTSHPTHPWSPAGRHPAPPCSHSP